MSLTIEEQSTGGYRVCYADELGIQACCYVDSMHCAYSKEQYLKAACERIRATSKPFMDEAA